MGRCIQNAERKKPCWPRFCVLAKLFFKSEWEIKTFPDKQKPTELVATDPLCGKCSRVLQSDTKDIDQTSKAYREVTTLIEVVLCRVQSLSQVWLCVIPWTTTHQAPLPRPPPEDIPNPGIESRFPTLQADSLPSEPAGKPNNTAVGSLSLLQGIFPTQEMNWGLLHWRQFLYQLTYHGSPNKGMCVCVYIYAIIKSNIIEPDKECVFFQINTKPHTCANNSKN